MADEFNLSPTLAFTVAVDAILSPPKYPPMIVRAFNETALFWFVIRSSCNSLCLYTDLGTKTPDKLKSRNPIKVNHCCILSLILWFTKYKKWVIWMKPTSNQPWKSFRIRPRRCRLSGVSYSCFCCIRTRAPTACLFCSVFWALYRPACGFITACRWTTRRWWCAAARK